MLLACSGGWNVGQITNDAAKDRLGQGRMYCLIGIGAQLPSFIEAAQAASVRVVIGGCPVACGKRAMENAGLATDVYVVATDLGIEKGHHFEYLQEEVARVAVAVADQVKALGVSAGGAPSKCCGREEAK